MRTCSLPSSWKRKGQDQFLHPHSRSKTSKQRNEPTRLAFVFEDRERKIFRKVGENAKRVFKTPARTNNGLQVDNGDIPFFHANEVETGVAPENQSVTAFTLRDVHNIVYDVLDHALIAKAGPKPMAKAVIGKKHVHSSVNISKHLYPRPVVHHTHVSEDLLVEPNVGNWTRPTVEETNTSAITLELRK